MRATPTLPQQALRLTFFTRPHCSLCTQAHHVLASVRRRRPFAYTEIDITAAGQASWRELYDFDVPVVRSPVISPSRRRGSTG